MLRVKVDEYQELLKKKEIELRVHERLNRFMQTKIESVNTEIEKWKQTHEVDNTDLNQHIVTMTEKKERAKESWMNLMKSKSYLELS